MAATLGDTGLEVSRIGLGLAALGRPGYINLGHATDVGADHSRDVMERRAHEVLDRAYAGGVRYFDAARSYGEAEGFVGSWLAARGLRPGEVTVGSKWGYRYTAGWRVDAEVHEVKELTAENLRRQLAETRERLGEHLSLYQIHSATLDSGVLDDGAVLDELARLRDTGVRVGLSTTGPAQGDTIAAAVSTGAFDTVQATWNVLEPSAGDALAAAHAAGLGVIVKEAVANGRLTARGDADRFRDAAAAAGVAPDALALAIALAEPWAGVVLSGASTSAMLVSNLAALKVSPETVATAVGALGAVAEPAEDYWRARSRLAWN